MVFTGIVEGTGIVTDIVHSKNLSELYDTKLKVIKEGNQWQIFPI